MKIYVVGNTKNKFLPLDNIREKFLVDQPHDDNNIDNLNPWYCELTGLYYLWKNCNDEIVGLEHYRRYFVNDKNQLLSEKEIEEILKNNDIILYKWLYNSVFENMIGLNYHRELKFILDLIEVLYNKEMHDFFENNIKQKGEYEGNMFICNKEIINEYCMFLFPLLAKFDECHKFRINRIDGYMAESLFGTWMQYKQKKIYDCPRITLDKNLLYELKGHV